MQMKTKPKKEKTKQEIVMDAIENAKIRGVCIDELLRI